MPASATGQPGGWPKRDRVRWGWGGRISGGKRGAGGLILWPSWGLGGVYKKFEVSKCTAGRRF